MKKIIPLLFSFFPFFAFASLQDDIIPSNGKEIINTTATGENFEIFDRFLQYARDSIFRILMLIAIAVFLYIGAKLITAR